MPSLFLYPLSFLLLHIHIAMLISTCFLRSVKTVKIMEAVAVQVKSVINTQMLN